MDFERARFNMVEQQIRPWDVLDQDVLDLMLATRREDFVGAEHRELAFSDLELPITIDGKPSGETMLQPKVEGRILQALALKKHESALVIGAGSGYLTALISYHARKVTALEINPDIAKLASAHLKNAGVSNVTVTNGDGAEWFRPAGSTEVAEKFDAIVFCGGLSELPETLGQHLTPAGRAFVFLGEFPVDQAKLLTVGNQKQMTGATLFETAIKPLRNFPKLSGFKF